MRLEALRAAPHPEGYRIDVAWTNPDPAGFPGVRVVRREHTHPAGPDDGVVVTHGTGLAAEVDGQGRALHRVADLGLKNDTVYYYMLFPYTGAPPHFTIDRANRVAALATAPWGAARQMFDLLPGIYRRYDAELGLLRRLLELPGGQLDLLQSFARAVLDTSDVARADGQLLPLLAEWIGWKTDFRLEVERQRNELRGAPAIYHRVGLIPVVGATVKRISGWESRSKEFVHNVVRSNLPPRHNLWGLRLAADGSPIPPAGSPDQPETLLSLDFAYDGRPAAAVDDHGIRWLFYHTLRRGRWRVWYKTTPTFFLGPEARAFLEAPDMARLQLAFAAAGVTLAADAVVTPAGSLWHVNDVTNAQAYVVEAGDAGLTVYRTTADALDAAPQPALPSPSLAPSRPLTAGAGVDEKDPAAALQGDTLWVFWSAYDRAAGRWELRHRLRRDGRWSETHSRLWEAEGDPLPQRRAPTAVVDQDGGLWLFWLERVGRQWVLRYNRHDGTGLDADPSTGWELVPPADFPADGPDPPRVESDAFAVFHHDDATRPIWIFWARKEAVDPVQTRWTVAYRVKAGIDPGASDWSAIEALPKLDPLAHDREPAARVDGDGNLTVFWSADRDGGWSIWRATLDLTGGPLAWVDIAPVTQPPYAQRSPLPVPLDGETLLVYRSNESLTYASDVYRATSTVDFRYGGSTTPHVRDPSKLGLRGAFEDFQHYAFDAGREDGDWYRRDTIGVYLTPDTLDETGIQRGVQRVARVLPEFMPATDRAVFIPGRELHTDYVYTYDAPGAAEPAFMVEIHADALSAPLEEPVLGPDTDFMDDLE